MQKILQGLQLWALNVVTLKYTSNRKNQILFQHYKALSIFEQLSTYFSISGKPQLPSKKLLVTGKKPPILSMFHGTLLYKCENRRYQKQQTKNKYFQENVHYSPLAVKCWKSIHLYFSIFHRLQKFWLSYILPFYQSTILAVEECKR